MGDYLVYVYMEEREMKKEKKMGVSLVARRSRRRYGASAAIG